MQNDENHKCPENGIGGAVFDENQSFLLAVRYTLSDLRLKLAFIPLRSSRLGCRICVSLCKH